MNYPGIFHARASDGATPGLSGSGGVLQVRGAMMKEIACISVAVKGKLGGDSRLVAFLNK